MGWGIGNGIGWPNASYQSGSVILAVENCNNEPRTAYLNGPNFLPGTFAYADPELTVPFPWGGGGTLWNIPSLINTIGGYRVDTTGEIIEPITTCPV